MTAITEYFLVNDRTASSEPTLAMWETLYLQTWMMDPTAEEHEAEPVKRPGLSGDHIDYVFGRSDNPNLPTLNDGALSRLPHAGWMRLTAYWSD